uniref:Uncharacterized protein n=1 Tax=Trichuris muris TaxID=70415 RepID=A0A5S6Q6A4_TRIMR
MDPTHSVQGVTVLMDLLHLQYAVLQLVLNCSEEIMEYNKKAVESLPSIIFNIITSIPSEACEFRKDVILLLRMFSKSPMRCLNELLEEGFLLGRGWIHFQFGEQIVLYGYDWPLSSLSSLQFETDHRPEGHTNVRSICSVSEGMTKALAEPNRSDVFSVQPFSLKWHQLLLFVLEVILGRLKVIVQEQLPRIIKSSSKSAESSDDGTVAAAAPVIDSSRMQIRKFTCPEATSEGRSTSLSILQIVLKEEEEETIYFDLKPNAQNFTLMECQVMVNAVLGCCRTIVWILEKYHTDIDQQEDDLKVLRQREVELLILIFKNGLVFSLDAFSFKTAPFQARTTSQRFSKEEKHFLEQFSSIFSNLYVR